MDKLRTRLLPVYLIAVVLVFGIGLLALVRLNQISVMVDNLTNELAVDRALSKDIINQILLTRFYANRYMRTQSQNDLDGFNAAFAQLEALLAEARLKITHPDRASKLEHIQATVATYGETFDEVTDLVKRRQRIYAEVLDIENLAMENALLALRVDAGFSENTDVFLAFGNVQDGIYQIQLNTNQYLTEGNPRYAIQLASNYREMLTALDSLASILGDSRYQVYVLDIRDSAHTYYDGFETIRADYIRSQTLLRRMFDELEPQISRTAAEMSDSIAREFQVQNATSQALIAQTRAVLLMTTTSAVLAGMGLAMLFSRYLTERLEAEQELRQYRDHLQHLVEERTAELTQTNERLRLEIAERERAEIALRESETNLARAQEIGHLGSWSLDYIRDRVEWSDEMYRLLGLTPGEPADLTFEMGFSRIHPEDGDALQALYEKSVAEGKSRFETEFRIMTGKGQLRTHRVLAEIERDAAGEVIRVFGIDLDITAQKQAEEALRRSEENFRQIFEANPFPLMILQRESGEVLMANRAAANQLGIPLDQLIGCTLLDDWASSTDRRAIMRELETLGQVTNRIISFETPAQQRRVMLLNMIPIERDGEVFHLAGSADITARVEAEETARAAKIAAERASRAKSTFLANMSHELRTPMSAVLGFTELMATDPNLTEEQRENLNIIGRSGEHLLALINDVLDLSKIEAGRSELQPEVFDLHEMLLGLGEMFSLRAERKGLTVVFDLSPNVPRYVRADAGKLRQVLINLLGNAVKFTEKGGITMRVRRRAEDGPDKEGRSASPAPILLHIKIEDTGVGIAPDELGKVFEAFEQTESGQRSKQGTGLGVPISQEYVRLMGGELAVQSEVGLGTAFSFDIRVEGIGVTETKDAQSEQKIIGLEPGQPVYRILIAEDDEANRELLAKLLRPLGFEVREAVDGEQAVAIWEDWRPHLIFMDIRMPKLDGLGATQAIRRQSKHLALQTRTVIIALTASAFGAGWETLLTEGCDDLIPKPFREASIFEVLERHLGVRFIYVDWDTRKWTLEALADSPIAVEELQAQIETLDPAWVEDMRQATLEGDLERMQTLIAQIRDPAPDLAEQIARLSDDFEHEKISQLLSFERTTNLETQI